MTHTTKHTPGPWVVRPDSTIESKDGVTIASFVDNEAEMSIISTAPAMYEALVRLAEKVRRANSIQHGGGKLLAEDWAELYQITNESFGVIAQAEGR